MAFGDRRMVFDLLSRWHGRGMKDAARDMDRTADKADDLDDSLSDVDRSGGRVEHRMGRIAEASKSLRVSMDSSRHKLHEMRLELAELADDVDDADFDKKFRALRKEERRLASKGTLVRDLFTPNAGGGRNAGGWLGTGIDFSQGVSEGRGMLIAVLIGAVVAALPTIGAMVAGAVSGAAGLGGIAGGVAAAATDPRVKDAWGKFAESFSADDFGKEAFVKPTIAALDELKSAWDDMDFGSALEKVAPYVQMVGKGIGDLGRKFMPGFNEALDKAGPFLAVLSKELGDTGQALGQMLADMASSEGSVEGLVALFDLLEGALLVLGRLTNALADTWDAMTDAAEPLTDAMADFLEMISRNVDVIPFLGRFVKELAGGARDLHGHFQHVNSDFDEAADAANQATIMWARLNGMSEQLAESLIAQRDALQKLDDAWQNHFGIVMSEDEARQRFEEGILRLNEGIREGGRDWRLYTEAGQRNRSNLLASIQDFENVRTAAIKAGEGSVEASRAANDEYQYNIEGLKKWALAHGLVKTEADKLFSKYEMKVYFSGIVDSNIQRVYDLLGGSLAPFKWSNLGKAAPVAMSPWDRGSGAVGAMRGKWYGGDTPGFASGGRPPVGMPYWVGEHGPELRIDDAPGTIVSHGASMGTTGGGATMRWVGNGDPLVEAIMKVLRDHIRVDFGGDPVAALGTARR